MSNVRIPVQTPQGTAWVTVEFPEESQLKLDWKIVNAEDNSYVSLIFTTADFDRNIAALRKP